MADDVELFIFAPAQLASQKSEFFEEVYFRRRSYMGAFNLASNMAAELSFQSFQSSLGKTQHFERKE